MVSTGLRSIALAMFALVGATSAQAQQVVLESVGPGLVTGLSADGRVATGQRSSDFQTFRWTEQDGMVPLGRNPSTVLGQVSGLPAISADGKVIASTIVADRGTYSTMGRRTAGVGGWQQLAPPLPPGGGSIDAQVASVFGMSGDGKAVAGLFWLTDGKAHAGVWTAENKLVDMGSSGGSSRIDGANADGSVFVGWDEDPTTGERRAAVWVHGAETILDTSEWPSEAENVNASGTIIVGQAADETNGFRESAVMWKWDGSTWVRTVLGVVAGGRNPSAYANAVSEDGRIVVGLDWPNRSKPQTVGFVWTAATGMMNADTYLKALGQDVSSTFTVTNIMAMTPDGSVLAAFGQDPNPPYTPGTLLVRRTRPPAP